MSRRLAVALTAAALVASVVAPAAASPAFAHSRGTSGAGVSTTYGVARALAYVGVALSFGGGSLVLMSAAAARRRAMLLVRAGAVHALAATAVAFGAYAATISGAGLGDAANADAWSTVVETRTGRMQVVRLVALAVVVGLVHAWRSSRAAWWMAMAGLASVAVAVVATFPASGHAGAVAPAALWVAIGASTILLNTTVPIP